MWTDALGPTTDTSPVSSNSGEDSDYCKQRLEEMWRVTNECEVALEENWTCAQEDPHTHWERCSGFMLKVIDYRGAKIMLDEEYRVTCS